MRCRLITALCSMIGFIFGSIFLIGGAILYTQFESIFGSTVRNQMYIDDSVLWWYNEWLNPSARETMTIHVFEMENVAQWRQTPDRTRPQLRVVGPFVFRVQRTKEMINFTNNDHRMIQYDERTVYHFDPLLSYESLDQLVTVANAELLSLNPFILNLIRRSRSVRSISNALTERINEILNIYQTNMFIERSIRRIIFGPTVNSDYLGDIDGENETLNDSELDRRPIVDDIDQNEVDENEITNEKIRSMHLQSDSIDSFQFGPNNLMAVTDDATKQIMAIYDQIRPYLSKMGVRVDPYRLLATQFGYRYQQIVQNDSWLDPLEPSVERKFPFNSMISFFRNDSVQRFNLLTGKETNRNGEIVRYNEEQRMNSWYGRDCNIINGTDGRQYGPFLRSKRIYEFNPKICRSIPFNLKEQGITPVQGVSYFRYSQADDFMQTPIRQRSNGCYCRWWNSKVSGSIKKVLAANRRCNMEGILDLGECYSAGLAMPGEGPIPNGTATAATRIPVILSNPHFSGSITESIPRQISGLTPDNRVYSSFVDVEPISGIVLNRVSRYQFNLHIRPIPMQLKSNRTIRELIMPLFWYEESWTASPEHQNRIKYFFVYPLMYQEYGIFGLIGAGVLLLIFGMLCLCFCCCGSNKSVNRPEPIDNDSKTNVDVKNTMKNWGKVSPEYVKQGRPRTDSRSSSVINEPIAIFTNQWRAVMDDDPDYKKNGLSSPAPPPPPPPSQPKPSSHRSPPLSPLSGNLIEMDQYNDYYYRNESDSPMPPMPSPLPPPPPLTSNGEMNSSPLPPLNGRNGNPPFPLERLKRDLPVRQSARNNATTVFTVQQQLQKQGKQKGFINYDEMDENDGQFDFYATQNGRFNDSGNDSWNSGYAKGEMDSSKHAKVRMNGRMNETMSRNGSVGYYESYDEYGRLMPQSITKSSNIVDRTMSQEDEDQEDQEEDRQRQEQYHRSSMNGYSMEARANLLAEIRQGTMLRQTFSPKHDRDIKTIERLIEERSTSVVQQIIQQIMTARSETNRSMSTIKSCDLELLSQIINLSSQHIGANNNNGNNMERHSSPITNNFIININNGGVDCQQCHHQSTHQMNQQQQFEYQQLLLTNLLGQVHNGPFTLNPIQQLTLMNTIFGSRSMDTFSGSLRFPSPPTPILSIPPPPFASNRLIYQPETIQIYPDALLPLPELPLPPPPPPPPSASPPPPLPPPPPIPMALAVEEIKTKAMLLSQKSIEIETSNIANQQQQLETDTMESNSISTDSIRFYGPYRAYNNVNTNQTMVNYDRNRPNTSGWNTSFDSDESNEE